MKLQMQGMSVPFGYGPMQDPDDSNKMIVGLDQAGLGLPDRDYYIKDDAKSKETRERYVQHVQKMFELMGDSPRGGEEECRHGHADGDEPGKGVADAGGAARSLQAEAQDDGAGSVQDRSGFRLECVLQRDRACRSSRS